MDHDEPIILESRNVKFKSISFDAILTNTRIHLTPIKSNVIPSQDIALPTIMHVETGENAIRDHFLIFSLMTDAGEKHQAVLTFARQAGVERKRECNEWAKKIKSLIPAPTPVIPPSDIPEVDREPSTTREVPTPAQGTVTSPHPAKKKIEITRPKGTIIEKIPVAQEPEKTTPLPPGSFCTRCGNRVPVRSTFCNYCGTPISQPFTQSQDSQPPLSEAKVSVPPRQTQPVITKVPEPVQPPPPQPVITKVPEPVQPPPPQPVITKASEPVQPLASSPEKHQGIQIVEEIHSIEPQIQDSVSRTQQQSEPSSTISDAGSSPLVVWPVFSHAESPATPAREAAPPASASPPPPLIPAPEGKRPNYLAIGILIMAILPILAGVVIVVNIMSGPALGPANTTPVIPVVSTIHTQLPQTTITPGVTDIKVPGSPQGMIPPTGVWVRVSYPGTYIGLIGTMGNQMEVTDTGDHLYEIPANERTVAAALQKKDSSGDQIILEVYKNGVMLKRETSISPKGIVEIQLDLKTQ
jgi:hypothetical protein